MHDHDPGHSGPASLASHLLEAGGHGPLGYHPKCPACLRERFGRVLSPGRSLTRHTRVVLATGLLALSGIVPAVGIAAEPDSAHEGVVAPEQQGGQTEQPGFDPGGDTALPFDSGPPPGGSPEGASPESTPVEVEPLDDPDTRFTPLAEPDTEAPVADEAAPVSPVVGSPPVTPPAAPITPDTEIEPPPPSPQPAPNGPEPQVLTEPGSRVGTDEARRDLRAVAQADPPAVTGPVEVSGDAADPASPPPASPPSPTLAPTSADPASTSSSVDADASANRKTADVDSPSSRAPASPRGARFHVVRPGESLWTIARRLLGTDASSAEVSAEVARLWALNRTRIASGDADVIVAGTKLRLR